jgi:hypothetical protein
MFWNFFKQDKKESKEQEPQNELNYNTWICYGIDEDGLSIDINIDDISEESLDNFAKLIAGISTMTLVPETLAIIKDGLKDEPEAYNFIIERAVEYATREMGKIMNDIQSTQESSQDEPIVKPSDIIQ